jgi:TM2 domain-containing membrane protein YozV
MALIECIDCGNNVSQRAQSCPKCGAPVSPPGPNTLNVGLKDQKDKTAAYLIWLFLGSFGGHKFYLNRNNAVTHLLSGTVSIILVIASPFSFGGYHPRDCGTIGYRPDCLPGIVEDPASFSPTFVIGLIGIAVVGVWTIVDLFKMPVWIDEANRANS